MLCSHFRGTIGLSCVQRLSNTKTKMFRVKFKQSNKLTTTKTHRMLKFKRKGFLRSLSLSYMSYIWQNSEIVCQDLRRLCKSISIGQHA